MSEKYIVDGQINYRRDKDSPIVVLRHGAEVSAADYEPEVIAELRRNGYLKTPGEALPAADVTAKLAEYERLKAELEALKAAQAAGAGGQRTEDLVAETEERVAAAKAGATRQPK